MEISEKTRKAYSEVDEFIDLLPEKEKNKIPENVRMVFKNEKDKNYVKGLSPNVDIKEQKLDREALAIIAMLNLNYWCEDEKEKNELRKIYEDNESAINESIQVEFVDDMFKNHKNNNENISDKVSSDVKNEKKVNQTINPNISKSVNIVVYKEPNIFKKCLSKIKKLFK